MTPGWGNPARSRHAGRVAGRNSHALSGLRAVDLDPGLPHIDGIALLKQEANRRRSESEDTCGRCPDEGVPWQVANGRHAPADPIVSHELNIWEPLECPGYPHQL